jgi:epoxide hydrolase 4
MTEYFNSIFIQTNGIRLHAVQAGNPEGPLVLLLHGFPEFWYGWKHQVGPLAEAGFRVLVPDQRGYNLSDKPERVSAYHVDELIQDILALIDWAGREQAALVGHDWGGILTWYLALRYPERVSRAAILNAPHPVVMEQHLSRNPRQMMRSIYALFFQIPFLPEAISRANDWKLVVETLEKTSRPGTFNRADFEEYRQAWWRKNAFTAMVNWYRASARRRPLPPANPKVQIPIQIIWGAQDFALGAEMVKPSLDLCAQGKLLFLEEATHWIQHEEVEKVNQTLLEFLQE